ncbi:SulP family inorganic anion transporter [Paracrocinitomix mangrovi]|uniref:SulP family inorganic anion transporter n=1 Tax=Paracrocinitomix mangrovi TaxID=2862509 RepID=UPI001C8ECC5C|nr:solute carrier family 23 protein [Paracrocinitomix mangrovi]UKN02051.1 SulP family inorganic anion transporter [Paracrocinitomix mangrovi]
MKEEKSLFKNLKFDITAGLVVFFVALPLCLGISLASTSYKATATLEAFDGVVMPGIIAGIVGGIIVGTFSGSRFGVSGPAAGLITIVSVAIVEFGGFAGGGFEKFALAVALGGAFQFIFGLIRAGFVAYYIPFSVIKGMLAGIGITIFIKELPHFFGYDKDPEGDMNFFQTDGHNTFSELGYMLDNVHWGATLVAVISLVILIVWGLKFIKTNKFLSQIPGPLIAILVSIAIAVLLQSNPSLLIEGEHLVNVPQPANFEEFKGMLYFPNFAAISDPAVWRVAIVIALVASIESLLCVEATDKMDPFKGRTPMNRELRAQGIGNMISGLLGGLPITQVIVRSSANITAGAKSKMSAIIHGIFLLGFIVAIPGLLNMIPRATLAAVLLLIGWKLASPKGMIQMIKSGWAQYVPFFVVIIMMLLTDLLIGVGSGIGVAFIIILYRNFKMSFFIQGDKGDNKVHLTFSQHTTFLNKASILARLDKIEDGSEVIIDLTNTISIDYDVSEAIRDFVAGAEDRDIKVEIIQEEKLTQVSMGH